MIDRLEEHRLRLAAAGMIPMTVEEVLGGAVQAGVPRPAFLRDEEGDGSREFVDPTTRSAT